MMMFQGEQEPVRGRSRSRQKPPVRPLLPDITDTDTDTGYHIYNHISLPIVACDYLVLHLIVCH